MVARPPHLVALVVTLLLCNSAVYAKYGGKICDGSQYSCYVTQRGDSWQKLFPDPDQRDLVMRINRMNTRLYSGLKIAIPKSFDDPLAYSPLPKAIDPPGEKTVIVSLSKLAFGAYDAQGNLVYWGPVSGGRGYCSDIHGRCNTPRGNFTIHSWGGGGCVSSKFPVGKGGAPMPYCMYFHGGFALHGSYEVPGYNASHGCVRMFINDAKWLNREFTAGERTRVIVKSE